MLVAWIAFLLGFLGFVRHGVHPTNALYNTLSLFRQRFSMSSLKETSAVPLELEVARYLAPLTVWLTALAGLLALLRTQREQARLRRYTGHVVVCGLGRRGRRLVEQFGEMGYAVVGIERDPDNGSIAACRGKGASVVLGDASDATVLRQARVDRAATLVAVCDQDETNVEIAAGAERIWAGSGAAVQSRFIHVQDDELRDALNQRMLRRSAPEIPLVEFFSTSERTARALLRRHSPLEGDAPPHLIVVGLGSLGSALVVAAGRLWATLSDGGAPALPITAVAPQAADQLARLALLHPALERTCELRAVEAAWGTLAFEQDPFLFRDDAVGVSHVYVCLDNEAHALAAALSLRRRLGSVPVPIVVAVASEVESAARFLATSDEEDGLLDVVGLIEESCTPALLLDSVAETVARLLHETYVREQRAAGGTKPNVRPWNELAPAMKEDNRAQARDMGRKLSALGYGIRPLAEWGIPMASLSEDEVEAFARMEHDRWVQARTRAGWQRGARDDVARRHPDLVPWSELSEESRDIDRSFARALPRILAVAGLQLRRVDAGDGNASAGEEVGPAPAV